MGSRHEEPVANETPYRHDDVECPVSRRWSRLARWSDRISVAAAVATFGIVVWIFDAVATQEPASFGDVLVPLTFVLLSAAFFVEKTARSRLDQHPELSGSYLLDRSRATRIASTWIFTTLILLVASCMALFSQIDITMGRPARRKSGRRHRGSLWPRYRREAKRPQFTGLQRLTAGVFWARAGLLEAESVVAFEQLDRELEALGAPVDLRRRLARAKVEERRHARECFQVLTIGVGIDISARTPAPEPRTVDLMQLASEQLRDGCYGEAYAARYAEAAAPGAAAELQPLLRVIAVDEALHAEDAWAVVAWLVQQAPEIVDDLRGLSLPATPPRALPAWLRPFASPRMGCLTRAQERRIHDEVVASIRARLGTADSGERHLRQ